MLRTLIRSPTPLPCIHLARSYALSRYPESALRYGRATRSTTRPQSSHLASLVSSQSFGNPQERDAQEQLWTEASQRAHSGDTNEALRRLVMDHDTLVVTRYAQESTTALQVFIL